MALEEIIARPITGINPFNELAIDAGIWREAHDHHDAHRYLHCAAAHRPGVIYGLEVVASATSDRTIVVAPGAGIDPDGQTLLLPEPVTFPINEKGQFYVTLSMARASTADSAVNVAGGVKYFRVVEGREVKPTKEIPKTAYIELARVFHSAADKPIRDAANPFDPAVDEINLLHRPVAFPHCYVDAGVGELSYVPKTDPAAWKPNRAGLWNLLREGNGRGFHLDFIGASEFSLRAGGARVPVLLYMAGTQGFQALADAELEGLRKYLGAGGVLFGEASGGSEDFGKGFHELAGKVGAKLQPVAKGSPLLSAHFMFSGAPAGANEGGGLFADASAGVVFSTNNYGGAWQGDIARPNAPDSRERIRQAQEFGLNVIAYAARRRRVLELSRLG